MCESPGNETSLVLFNRTIRVGLNFCISTCNLLNLHRMAGKQDPKYGFIETPLVSHSLNAILKILQPQNKT